MRTSIVGWSFEIDLKSFFIAMQENGRTGGLFVFAILSFLFVALFWKLALTLGALALILCILIWSGRILSELNHKGIGAVMFFFITALALTVLALGGREAWEVDAFQLVVPVAGIISIFYSLSVLKTYLCLSVLHKFVYFALPILFAATIGIQFLHDQP